ncbi:hypothetical protein CPB85DRAFT_104390 [Mucidula mucida]|nr:hypothetical protein CPB85DRAFT_104390 [Mucidula mucida]
MPIQSLTTGQDFPLRVQVDGGGNSSLSHHFPLQTVFFTVDSVILIFAHVCNNQRCPDRSNGCLARLISLTATYMMHIASGMGMFLGLPYTVTFYLPCDVQNH